MMKIMNIYFKVSVIFLITIVMLTVVFVVSGYASTSDELDNFYNEYGRAYGSSVMAPNVNYGDDMVDVSRADIAISETDFVINGRNGMRIPIIRKYNADMASGRCFKETDVEYDTPYYLGYYYNNTTTGTRVLVGFQNEFEAYENKNSFVGVNETTKSKDTSGSIGFYKFSVIGDEDGSYTYVRDTTAEPIVITKEKSTIYTIGGHGFTDQYVKLGYGWAVSKPGLSLLDYYAYYDDIYYWGTFQDIHGKIVNMKFNYYDDDDTGITEVEMAKPVNNHESYKIVFVDETDYTQTQTYEENFEYNFYIESIDGYKYYFYINTLSNYSLKAVEDLYGNAFLYNSPAQASQEFTYTDCNTGISYTVTPSGITKRVGENTVELVAYDYAEINSEDDTDNAYICDNLIKLTVYKNESETSDATQSDNWTKYHISKKPLTDALFHVYGVDKEIEDDIMLVSRSIDTIEYPTGLKKNYEYAVTKSSRTGKCKVKDSFETFDDDEYNRRQYSFTQTYVTGQYVYDINTAQITEFKSDGSKNKILKYTFDDKGRTTEHSILNAKSSQYKKETYTYDCTCYDSPMKTVTERIKASFSKSYVYDDYHRLAKSTEGDIITEYTYGDYNNITEILQHKDADTEVKTVNTLTSDGKSVAETSVYENDVLKNKKSYTYNTDGTVATETTHISDAETSTTSYTYSYDNNGGTTVTSSISGITDADGNTEDNVSSQTHTDVYGNTLWTKDGNNNVTASEYDLLGRVTKIIGANSSVITYAYNDLTNITTFTDAENNVLRVTFDPWGNAVKTEYLDNGTYKTIEQSEYDEFHRLSLFKRYRSNNSFDSAVYTYDFLGRPASETVKDTSGSEVRTTGYTYTDSYDSDERPVLTVSSTVSQGDTTYITTENKSDYLGNNLSQKIIDNNNNTREYTYTYDYFGNMLTSTAPDNTTEAYTYDHLGNVLSYTNSNGKTKTNSYDMANQKVSETDFKGNATTYIYDKAGRNIKIIYPFDTSQTSTKKMYYDANGNMTKEMNQISASQYNKVEYSYDIMNNLSMVTTHESEYDSSTTRYYHDLNGNLGCMITGLSSASSNDGKNIVYTYDALGRCISAQGTLSVAKSYEYDYAGNMTKETKPMGSVVNTYDTFGNLTSVKAVGASQPLNTYTYNALGQRTSMTDETGTTTYTYDGFGNLTTETKGDIIKMSTYDVMGRRLTFNITDNGTNILSNTYTYDNAGNLLSVTSNGNTMTYTYDDNGNVLTETGTDTATTYTYNNANLITEKVDTHGTDIIDRYYQIQYDLMGNRTAMTDNTTNFTHICLYSNDGKLGTELKTTADGQPCEISYQYDKLGNMSSKAVYFQGRGEHSLYNYYYGDYNQLDSVQVHYTETEYPGAMPDVEYDYYLEYTYDANGNMTGKTQLDADYLIESSDTYTFDIFGRMTQSTSGGTPTTYTYNGDGLRTSKTTNNITTTHILDGMNVVADMQGDTTSTFSRGLSLFAGTKDNITSTYLTNVHGDISAEIKPNNTINRNYYDNYGDIIDSEISDIPFGYNGEYTDTESGLIYLRARYYDPEIGRFISEDPIMDGTNWYSYCEGNPVMYKDPSGLLKEKDYQYGNIALKKILLNTLVYNTSIENEWIDSANRAAQNADNIRNSNPYVTEYDKLKAKEILDFAYLGANLSYQQGNNGPYGTFSYTDTATVYALIGFYQQDNMGDFYKDYYIDGFYSNYGFETPANLNWGYIPKDVMDSIENYGGIVKNYKRYYDQNVGLQVREDTNSGKAYIIIMGYKGNKLDKIDICMELYY